MKRKKPKTFVLTWVKLRNSYELIRRNLGRPAARIWGPEEGFDVEEFHYAAFDPRKDNEIPIAAVRGCGSSLSAVRRMAEASVQNTDWWGNKQYEFERSAFERKPNV